MNSLSWMIYAADVAQGLQVVLGILAVVGMVTFVGWSIARTPPYPIETSPPKWLVPTSIILLFLAAVIPSRNTVYMIAASEVASRSETLAKAGALADPAIDLLRKKIDDALKAK
jgi:protein-S-isoprenylcysteine O-methyltransferase Ste14